MEKRDNEVRSRESSGQDLHRGDEQNQTQCQVVCSHDRREEGLLSAGLPRQESDCILLEDGGYSHAGRHGDCRKEQLEDPVAGELARI